MKYRNFLSPPVFLDDEKTRIAQLVNAILWVMLAILMGLFAFSVYSLTYPGLALLVIMSAMAMAAFGLFMIHHGQVRLTAFVVSAGHWIIVTGLIFGYGSVLSPGPINYVGSILIVSLLLGGQLGLIFAGFSTLTTLILALAELNGFSAPAFLPITPISMWAVLAANFIFVAILAGLTHRSTARALALSRQNEKALEETNTKLTLEVADRVEAEIALRVKETELLTKSESLAETVARLEEESQIREELNASLLAKNEELEQFTYTVSHDLKSPLVTIKGFLGFIEQDIQASEYEQIPEDMNRIREAVVRMEELLDDLLELSRIGRLINPPQWISTQELVETAVSALFTQIESRSIQLHIQPNLPDVYGDPIRLTEVWQNLIDNAIKYMGDQPHPHIEIGAEERADEIVCYVQDNGIGINPKFHDEVFGLFNRLHDKEVEGTGVGLALVQRIVEVHNGRVWLESRGENQGSTFYFTLPKKKIHE